MDLNKKINKMYPELNLDYIYSLYTELDNGENTLQIENLSIDFIISNHSTFNVFKTGILRFQDEIRQGSGKEFKVKGLYWHANEFKVREFYLNLRLVAKKYYIPFISGQSNANNLEAKFFDNNILDKWIQDEIELKLNKGISIKLLDGLIITMDDNKLKVLFNNKIFDQSKK